MIKTIFKFFYNKILSICYDTQKNSQDDIIIDFNKYDTINIDYKIQKKTDFYNGDFIENDSLNNKKIYNSLDNTFINDNTNLNNEDICENNLFNIHNENSYDDCKSTDDIDDIDNIDDIDDIYYKI
tara:strand:+ start:4071 stop:4448 length:378 start_codon:yes stop_codon:yes gene_type:complete